MSKERPKTAKRKQGRTPNLAGVVTQRRVFGFLKHKPGMSIKELARCLQARPSYVNAFAIFLRRKGMVTIDDNGSLHLTQNAMQYFADIRSTPETRAKEQILGNRRQFIDTVNQTWEQLSGKDWRTLLADRNRVATLETYFQNRLEFYLARPELPQTCKTRAQHISSLLGAIRRQEWKLLEDHFRFFKWPSIEARHLLTDERSMVELPTEGLLGTFGYRVGKYGLSNPERIAILDHVFAYEGVTLPDSEDWIASPSSCGRLRHMANALAILIRQAQKQTRGDYSLAISQWTDDLGYLKRRYYDGRCNVMRSRSMFLWPN